MIKIIEPHANIELPAIRRVLLVYKDWGEPAPYSERWNALRAYLVYFRANPRSSEYMSALAGELLDHYASDAEVDMLTDVGLAAGAQDGLLEIGKLWQCFPENPASWPSDLGKKLTEGYYDTVIFMFPDAVGLGFDGVERVFTKFNYERVLVINGRRRFFILDSHSRKALIFRRFMARAWGFEMLLVPFILVIAAVLAFYDALTGQSQQKRSV